MLVDHGLDGEEALADLRELDLEVVALDRAQAEAAALLRSATREAELSLGNQACLALAQQRRVPMLTTDRRQAEVASAIGVTAASTSVMPVASPAASAAMRPNT